MSTASPVINQNIEIITVLCQSRHPGAAVAFNGLLAALQSRFPSTGWTSTLLHTLLTAGIKQGLFTPVGSNPAGPVEGYALNRNMLSLNNPRNFLYEPFCSQILPLPCTCKGDTAGAGTSY